MTSDIFLQLPTPTALLLLFGLFDLGTAHAVHNRPRRTAAVAIPAKTHHVLDVVPYPPRPTSPPLAFPDFLRRGHRRRQQQAADTVCGYVGGDPNLPATCSVGSHCVLDAAHGVVGCCPDGQDPCTTGVFTACVDGNSPAQGGAADPYAYTCGGGDVCYRNEFEGGYFQYGCGTASDMAATVFASASGISLTVQNPSMTVMFTETRPEETATTGSDSTASSGTPSSSSPSSSTPSSSTPSSTTTTSSSSSSSTAASTHRTHTTSTPDSTAAPPATGNADRPPDLTGAIVGGTISGVAVLVAAIALGIFFWRRRRGRANTRFGPGPGPKSIMKRNISPPLVNYPGDGGGEAGFQPLHQSHEAWETGLAPGSAIAYPSQSAQAAPPQAYPSSAAFPEGGATPIGGRGADGDRLHGDMVPLTREIDDFSRGFHDALDRITEEDRAGGGAGGLRGDEGRPTTSDGRPLWQQNRRLSRNMMWM